MSSPPSSLTTAVPQAISPPEVQPFGPYLLLHAFARGGMGEVYLARLGRGVNEDQYCVLKKLRPELTQDREYVRRFIDEARVVVQLHHPNICHVFDVGRVADEYYLAMEFVSGHDARTLQNRARERGQPLPAGGVLHLVCEILEALDYAHQRNHPLTGEPLHLIHRDVSPQNVLVRYDGAVKLIDFGLASSKLKIERTQPNVVMGKMAYMAPEQARGEGIDASVDLFAVAVLTYELLTGQRFYEGMRAQEIWAVAGRGDFVPRNWSSLPTEVARILSRALHTQVEKRFPSAQAFRQAIVRYLDQAHPEAGQEHLADLMSELFADERARDEQMLQRFALTVSDELSEAVEASCSLRVSLAQSEYSMSFGIVGEGRASATGHEEHNPIEMTEATQLRLAAFQAELHKPQRYAIIGMLVVTVLCAALGVGYWLGSSSSLPPSLTETPVASAAARGTSIPNEAQVASLKDPQPEPASAHGGERASQNGEPIAEISKFPRAGRDGRKRNKRKEDRAFSRSPSAKTKPAEATSPAPPPPPGDPVKSVEKEMWVASSTTKPVLPSATPDNESNEVKPQDRALQTNQERRRQAKEARSRERKARRTDDQGSAEASWRSLTRRQRLGILKTCTHPCRQEVSGAFVRLQVKIKSASATERRDEERKFDEKWQRCFRSCEP